MYLHRDVLVGLDSQLHHVELVHTAGRWRVDGGPEQSGRASTMARLAVTADGQPWVLLSDWQTGIPFLIHPDGRDVQIGTFGVGAYGCAICAVGNTVEVAVRGGNDNDATAVTFYDSEGRTLRSVTVPYAPQVHRLEPDGYPVTDTDPRARLVRTVNGVTLFNCAEDQGWIVGHADGDIGGEPRGVAVLVSPTGEMQMWPYPTAQSPQSPRIAVQGATVWVALSNENTPQPGAIPWQPFVPWVEKPAPAPVPAIVTDLVIPRPTGPLPPCWFGGWDGAPGNCQAGYAVGDTRPVVEQISRWPIPASVPLLAGYLGSDDGADYTAQEIAAVKARPDGRAIFVHIDDPQHTDRMLEVVKHVETAGLVAVLGGHVVPQRAPWGIIRSYHFGWDGKRYVRSSGQVAHEQSFLTELRRTVPGCVLDLVFGWRRPGGQLHCQELGDYARDVADLTPTPAGRIGEVVSQPPAAPAPVPPPPAPGRLVTAAEIERRRKEREAMGKP